MPATTSTPSGRRFAVDLAVSAGLAAVILFFVASGLIAYLNTRTLNRDSAQVTHTHEVLSALDNVLSLMKDAETGQRGFVLTGNERYLEPYNNALIGLDDKLANLALLTRDNPAQQARIAPMRVHITAKINELRETIELRRKQGFEAALAVVLSDRGKSEMEIVRAQVGLMQRAEKDLRRQRLEEMTDAYRTAVISGVMTGALGVLLSLIVAHMVRRATLARRREEWLQRGQAELATAMLGELRVDRLAENILAFLVRYLDAHAAAFFVREHQSYRRVATIGVPAAGGLLEIFDLNDGLLGQVAKTGKTIVMHDVPGNYFDGYLSLGSALGHGVPRQLVVAPAVENGDVNAVFELGFVHPLNALALELLDDAAEAISVAVRAAIYRANLQNLLEETQRQGEELQAQSEELRVSNEELEEQSRTLKESATRLEQQQAELEQTNAQLEEQAQQLEGQRDDLERAKQAVEIKARELEQASQYKSDFLANMSHELRTPLNSSLILAKLLADNPAGNLSAEQVKFAQTIQSSGNDLLSLINDILDLSKIEAGYMEVQPETVGLRRLLDDLGRVFDPLAQQKRLAFTARIAPGCPDSVVTDRQRLEQILKNLLSNAVKFTEKGEVGLTVSRRAADGRIAFAVADTGIGITPEQQQSVFDAFRQADGTISRKYGGTGLGLSISRELAQLLGGTIEVSSVAGQGSIFTIILPDTYDASQAAKQAAETGPSGGHHAPSPADTPAPAATSGEQVSRTVIPDDRNRLGSRNRVILVVEDDASFARILYELAHEMGFDCLIATTADDALVTAQQYLPNAIVLDVNLPDHSGLSVLDRLKRDGRTRHIPVHVVSASDNTAAALSLGAVGYMLKPVKRDDLAQAFQKLETRLSQPLRRVLIVEDDPVQLDSVRRLLATLDVETVGVGTAAECLERLRDTTFDCMVLDLTLPDASGYSLLETLSSEDAYAFPPVIVYTGRDLPPDEEQRLRKYSRSIIIKGAKSPERLLDEVTLFLHQVEAELPPEQKRMLETARNRDAVLEGRRILIVEDDVRNVYSLTSILEPRGAVVQIARNGREALDILSATQDGEPPVDLVLMDVMMPEMDGLTATREIRKRPEWKKLPVIMLTAKAMRDDQERCLEAGANDYMAKPLDVEKLLSLVRVWMPR